MNKAYIEMSTVKTYHNKKAQVQSDRVLNNLFAVNIGKRKLTRKNGRKKTRVKGLPQRNGECYISDESLHVNREMEDTFDKILNTTRYREIEYVNISQFRKCQSDTSSDASNPVPADLNCRHDSKKTELNDVQVTSNDNAESSCVVESSLCEHSDNQSSFVPILSSTLYDKVTSNLKETNFIESTPLKPTKKPMMNVPFSPICNSPQSLPSNILEKSYEEIKKWDNSFPDISDLPDPKQRKFAISRTFAKSIKLNPLDDWKLRANAKVTLEKTVDLLGVVNSVHIQNRSDVASSSLECFKNSDLCRSNVSKRSMINYSNSFNGLVAYLSDHQYSLRKHIMYKSIDDSISNAQEKCSITNDQLFTKTPVDFKITRRKIYRPRKKDSKIATRKSVRSSNISSKSRTNENNSTDENSLYKDTPNFVVDSLGTDEVPSNDYSSDDNENSDKSTKSTNDLAPTSAVSNDLHNSIKSTYDISADVTQTSAINHNIEADTNSMQMQISDLNVSERTQNESDDVVFVTTCSKYSLANTKKSDGALAVLNEEANDSVVDLTEDNSLQMPYRAPLKPGKLWKRSLSVFKMFNGVYEIPNNSNTVDSINCSKTVRNRRTTVKIELVNESKTKLNCSVLESYATFSGYESDQENTDKSNLDRIIDGYTTVLKQLYLSSSVKLQPHSAKDIVLQKCGQTEVLPFEERFPSYQLEHCHKIGEGVYGEVFLWRLPNGGTSVLKIIPIEGSLIVNNAPQKKYNEVLSEIVIIKELSDLREKRENQTNAFCKVKQIDCVKGKYPDRLLDLWELYDEVHQSENDSPEMFGDDQLYIVLELQNGGSDLEKFEFESIAQAYSILTQIAYALAVAETELQFEHRDLHWGNILITTCDANKSLHFCLNGKSILMESNGVQATIIDFTLSRITCDGVIIYNDLSTDLDLFNADGDYQFDIYRLMQKENGNNWKNFTPYTNVLWLHYLVDKLIDKVKKQVTKGPNHDYYKKLKNIKAKLLKCKSAKEVVTNLFHMK